MVSRRSLLAGGSSLMVGVLGVTIKQNVSQETESGVVYNKYVNIVDKRTDSRYFVPFRLTYANRSNTVYGSIWDEFDETYESPATLQVDEATHTALTDRFDEISYGLAFENKGNLTGYFSREDFNRISLGDSVEVVTADVLGTSETGQVASVTKQDIPLDDTSVRVVSRDDLVV